MINQGNSLGCRSGFNPTFWLKPDLPVLHPHPSPHPLEQGIARHLASSPSRIKQNQTGFTLIELVVFIVIVSIAIVGILSVMNVVVQSSADPMIRKQSAALADSILEEILLKDFDDPDGGANVVEVNPLFLPDRTLFDDVDDYNGQSNPLFTDLPPALATYIIGIVVSAPAALNGINMKRVTVTITHGAEAITMTGYRADF